MSRSTRSWLSRRMAAGRSRRRHQLLRVRLRLQRAGWAILRTVLTMALPFFLLVTGSVLSHRVLATPGWVSTQIGCVIATICVALLGARLWRRWTGRDRLREISRNVALPVVLLFVIYSLGWVTSPEAKSPEIRDLHPTLRLAIGTATLTDPHVVVTEISRNRADYTRMGLTPISNSNSLHFEQTDGWTHAVDLRTRGRSEVRNRLSQLYFRAMGLRALRHGGTGDHLHVGLPRPWR